MKYTVDLQYFGGRGADSGLNRTKATIRTDISELKKRRQEYADREFNRKTEEESKIILRNQNRLLREELDKQAKAMTEQEFLNLKGVGDISSGYTVDKLRGNRQLKTERGKKRFEKELQEAEDAFYEKKQKARDEYKKLVKEGKIRDKSPLEKRLDTAHGHPDLASTQAARRLLNKMGYDWQTGKKLNR